MSSTQVPPDRNRAQGKLALKARGTTRDVRRTAIPSFRIRIRFRFRRDTITTGHTPSPDRRTGGRLLRSAGPAALFEGGGRSWTEVRHGGGELNDNAAARSRPMVSLSPAHRR
jgi:hypothetical protein